MLCHEASRTALAAASLSGELEVLTRAVLEIRREHARDVLGAVSIERTAAHLAKRPK